jgi:hypothetical protein
MPTVPNESMECPCQEDCTCNPNIQKTFCCCDACDECAKCGCMDSSACNFDAEATLEGPECDICKQGGCMDSCDDCYNPDAECSKPEECCGCTSKCDCAGDYPYYGQWGGQT